MTPTNLRERMASFYKSPPEQGAVALVLGAGNIAAIPVLDMLHKLFLEGQVCILKMNPVNDYLGPIFEDLFADFVAEGLSLIHIWRCRRLLTCRSRWSPYH